MAEERAKYEKEASDMNASFIKASSSPAGKKGAIAKKKGGKVIKKA